MKWFMKVLLEFTSITALTARDWAHGKVNFRNMLASHIRSTCDSIPVYPWWFYIVPVYRATISLSHASVRCQSWLMHRWRQPQTCNLSHTQSGGDSLASLQTIIFRLNLKNYMKTSKCEVAYLTVSDVSPQIPVQKYCAFKWIWIDLTGVFFSGETSEKQETSVRKKTVLLSRRINDRSHLCWFFPLGASMKYHIDMMTVLIVSKLQFSLTLVCDECHAWRQACLQVLVTAQDEDSIIPERRELTMCLIFRSTVESHLDRAGTRSQISIKHVKMC